jgi:hypothetical protein
MNINFEVEMPDETFEEFFRLVHAFEQAHPGVAIMMDCSGNVKVREMVAIMQRVMPTGTISVVKDAN